MIAFGTFKKLSAFKMYAKSQNISFEISNKISKQLEKYEMDLKYASDDEKDLIDVYDYIDEKYHEIYKGSEKYTGIISSKSKHPCASLIYQGNIKEELGLIKLKSESTNKEFIATVIDGHIAEDYKFLKNDLLKVDVVYLIDKIYKRINKKTHTVNELMEVIKNDTKTWDIYANGLTMCINQVEKESTTKKVMRYKPRNLSELTAFISAIRPSFRSIYSMFESRQSFDYGIESFDNLMQTDELPYSFVLYQEQIMATLSHSGFQPDETYGIIKAIAKKKPSVVKPLKERFTKGFSERIKKDEGLNDEDALIITEKIWQIIDDSSAYSFNASHAFSYALDSLYCAYLKANYPFEFYEVMLEYYANKGSKDKVSKLKQEMYDGFGIQIGDLVFRNDNRGFVSDKEQNKINESMVSVKYLNHQASENLYLISKGWNKNFIDLLIKIKDNKCLDSRQLGILVKLNYFSEFANNQKILDFVEYFDVFYNAKSIKKSKYLDDEKMYNLISKYSTETPKTFKGIDWYNILIEIFNNIDDKQMHLSEQAKSEAEYMGYVKLKEPKISDKYYIALEMSFGKNKLKPFINMYNVKEGKSYKMRIKDGKHFAEHKFKEFDILKVEKYIEEPKVKKIDGKYKTTDEKELVITNYYVV